MTDTPKTLGQNTHCTDRDLNPGYSTYERQFSAAVLALGVMY
jgi:hypothetical protein